MDRLSHLSGLMQSSQGAQAESPEEPSQSPPPIVAEIERLKVIRKKYQSLEDTERCMSEWKAKGSLDLLQFESYVLGEISLFSQKYLDFMKNDPDYALTELEGKKDDQRRLTNLLLFKLVKKFPVSLHDFKTRPWDLTALFLMTGLTQRSVSTKIAVHFFLYGKSILALGTDKHLKFVENALTLKDLGCFALTELSHGSNVQGCLTNAVFDEQRKDFVLYTPHERGMKFWIGNAAQTANMAVIAANLIVKGKDYGMHMFVVEIRDRVTHNLLPGVTIGDCGEKMGLNGVDNGFMFFRGLRVSRDALLNKITDVDENGTVTSKFEYKSKRFAVQLSALSDGRVKVGTMSCLVSIKSVCIALRFATVRKQFGKEKYKELPILEYPSMRNRLLPLLALAVIPLFSARKINNLWYENSSRAADPKNWEMKELHALISIIKPLTTEWTNANLSECRKAMGGLGYSWYAEVPKMINDIHVMTTWEGDNNVLLQQVSRFVLGEVNKQAQSGQPSPYPTLQYLADPNLDTFKVAFTDCEQFNNLETLHQLMKVRAKRAAFGAAAALSSRLMAGEDAFDAWNNAIPFDLDVAAKTYGELYIYEEAMAKVLQCPEPRNKSFLHSLLVIFAISRFRESYEALAESLGPDQLRLANDLLLVIYEKIKYNAVLCFDGLLMDDEIVRSPFGSKSGKVYEQFLSRILAERDNFGRSPYWKEIVNARNGCKFDLR